MKKKLTIAMLIAAMCVVTACSGGNKEDVKSDKKPEATESTANDPIGEDSEIQMTTKNPDEGSSEEPSASTSENTTSNEPSSEEETTNKPSETTTKQETTTKKEDSTTTKNEQQTTTKKQETSTQETTTKKEQQTTTNSAEIETNEQATTNSAYTESDRGNAITITEFSPSTTAINKAKAIVSSIIANNMSDYECVKAIHDYLIKNVNYDYAGLEDKSVNDPSHPSHTAESALCSNLAVCDGYAQAFELLCAQVGIEVHMMYGEAGNAQDGYESHAWNVVKLAGEWYQVDCTWDDPLINDVLITDGSNITYQYFLLTDSEMYVDHILNKADTPNEKICTSTLFKGLGETLSLQVAMGEPGIIVVNSKSFYTALYDYFSKGILECYIAVPNSEIISWDEVQNVIKEALTDAELYGSYVVGYTHRIVSGYAVWKPYVIFK